MALLQNVRLTLSTCRPDDRADFVALESDPEVMRFLNGRHALDQEQSDPGSPFLMPRGTEPYVWTARWKASGAFVGWFCLWPESGTMAELGFRLRRVDWGQGLATEGASALINWGFQSAGYDRIFASAMTVNLSSRRVLEKIGLNYARTIHVDWPERFPGTEDGEIQYELIRAGWNGG